MKQNRIVLGGAQLGMHYGINNKRGKIPKKEVFAILLQAWNSGFRMIDTASTYGDSEKIIGEFIKKEDIVYNVVSKLSPARITMTKSGSALGARLPDGQRPFKSSLNLSRAGWIRKNVFSSLKRLNIKKFYGYLFHDFEDYKKSPGAWDELKLLKSEGKIKKIGFSLYYPHEIEYFTEQGIVPDIVQLPYNIFDRRFEPYFGRLKNAGIEIHARSIFLQGLVFKDPKELAGNAAKIKSKLKLLNKIVEEFGVPIFAVCLNFALCNRYIDKAVVGVDTLANVKELLSYTKYKKQMNRIVPKLAALVENDEKVVLPVNWR